MSTFPVTYELDESGDANGIAHPYCSRICQLVGLDIVPEPMHAEYSGGEDVGGEETVCECCGIYLHKKGKP